ncbi:MAG: hypothetical protein AMS14_09845 [Planctomycetes bacterium DG_20]|nr:MAG: hypothetical protein AMS14_09845 [Planctomycetes bacterium DG_20]
MFGVLALVPLAVQAWFAGAGEKAVAPSAFYVPAAVALGLGVVLKRNVRFPALDSRQAMILCALAWFAVSAVGALPLWLGLDVSYLDAYFESVSGFTTTGITMLQGLEGMPRGILFWRSFIQWLGGLGILTFFLAILYTGESAHQLFGAESHKVFSRRPAPGLFHTLKILWLIYAGFTVAVAGALLLEGLSVFDAVAHAMTALSTGGYSPYDASIAQYRQTGHPHFILIEYTVTVGMLLGGISFFVHYRVLRGGVRALWDSLEMRLWWAIVFGATALVMLDHFRKFGLDPRDAATLEETFRTSIFQVVALVTTTGFGTRDIAADYFPGMAKQLFLVLMVVGGCVGSTGGGVKVLRVGVLLKMLGRQMRRLIYGRAVLNPVVVDGEVVDTEELRRVAALFFAWMVLLVFGGAATALLSDHGALESASGMFSALGNIGPCYMSVPDMSALHPFIKVVYIIGMVAGRLEILPLLLLVSRRTWK